MRSRTVALLAWTLRFLRGSLVLSVLEPPHRPDSLCRLTLLVSSCAAVSEGDECVPVRLQS